MALRERNNVKLFSGNVDAEFSADEDESFLIKNILVYNPASDYVTVKIGRTTVGYFRVGTELGSHLAWVTGAPRHAHDITTGSTASGDETDFVGVEDAGGAEIAATMLGNLTVDTTYPRFGNFNDAYVPGHQTILEYLAARGLFAGYPVPKNKKFIVEGAAQANAFVLLVYDWYDPEDITADMQNGEESNTLVWLNYGNSGAAINADGFTTLDTPENPSEFDDFPFGERAPNQIMTRIHGFLASDFAPVENDATDDISTEFLRLKDDRRTLFDVDDQGWLMYNPGYAANLVTDEVAEGLSLIGNLSDRDARPPLILETPLEFTGDEQLLVQLGTSQHGSGQNISADEQTVGVIMESIKG